MGKPLEMYVLIFLQSMVQIRARNVGFTTKILFRFFCILSLGALVAESPQEGAIWHRAAAIARRQAESKTQVRKRSESTSGAAK